MIVSYSNIESIKPLNSTCRSTENKPNLIEQIFNLNFFTIPKKYPLKIMLFKISIEYKCTEKLRHVGGNLSFMFLHAKCIFQALS